jgi:hypothetical protein
LDNRATGDECANQVSLLVFQLPVNEEDLVAHVVRRFRQRRRGSGSGTSMPVPGLSLSVNLAMAAFTADGCESVQCRRI